MSVSYGGDSIVFADGSVDASGFIGNRNRIINGAMVFDQRNAGASITPTDGGFLVDRFRFGISQTSKFTSQQTSGSVTPPTGFTNYLGLISSSAYTPVTGDYFFIGQRIEGYNVADLAWGTAAAVPVTLSFWVRSSLTGSFGGALQAGKSYTFSYTINAANTWEYKSITISGDTSTAMSSVTTGKGIELIICLGSGSGQQTAAGSWTAGGFVSPPSTVNVCATNGATFYITGVQLERGSTASSFEYRSYGTELIMCQRYYEKSYPIEVVPGTGISNGEYCFWYGYGANSAGSSTNAIECWTNHVFKVQKRASVTVVTYDLAGNSGQASRYYTGVSPAGNVANTVNLQTQMGWKNTVAAGSAANGFLLNWTASAEL
jgi:hypothetical protein